jgi:hypothetical protein
MTKPQRFTAGFFALLLLLLYQIALAIADVRQGATARRAFVIPAEW